MWRAAAVAAAAGLAGCAGGGRDTSAPAVTASETRAVETYGPAVGGGDSPGASQSWPIERSSTPDADTPGGWEQIGQSVQGRAIIATTVRGPTSSAPRVLIIGSIHGTELEGLAAIDRLVDDLRAHPVGPAVRVIRDMNPDGSAARTRGNSRGVDLNRNWPAASFFPGAERGDRPLSEPEALAVWRELERFDPTLVIVLHSTASGPYVNYDGPAVDAATRFAGAASVHDPRWRVVADMGYPTPGSLGSLVGDDRRVPILTIEFDRGQRPESVWGSLRDGVRAACEAAPVAALHGGADNARRAGR